MASTRSMALYLDPSGTEATADGLAAKMPSRSLLRALIFSIVAAIIMVLGASAVIASNSSIVSADQGEDGNFAFLCGDSTKLGSGMDERNAWQGTTQRYVGMDLADRTWTAQELFGSNLRFPHYEGEGPKEKTVFVRGKGTDSRIDKAVENGFIDQSVADKLNGDVKENLAGLTGINTCTFGAINNMMGNAGFSLSSILASWVGIFATTAFDSGMICKDADDTGCLNLLKIVGGTGGESEGVIGTLTSSVYFPLLTLVVLITAIWIAYIGIAKRRFTEALTGALWMFAAIILGTTFLLNPSMIAKAPMTVANAAGTCIIGGFTGANCFDNGSVDGDTISSSDEICKSEAAGSNLDNSMTLAVNGMSCSIWKAFVLEPYAQASFGRSFDGLDTSDPDEKVKEQLTKAGIDDPENTFKVNLGSSSAGEDMEGEEIVLDSDPSVSNIALYQLYLMTSANSDGDADDVTEGAVDGRWYNVVSYAAADEATWNKWTGSFTGGAGRNALATMSLITTVLGGAIVLITSLLAIVYYVITIVLMGVAPLFFLMAVVPGRGRRLFLGWFGQIAGNVMKYIASAFFLVITVALYSGVLANTENIATTFIFILILSAALFMYRAEIVNLLGRVEMGGEALSNRLGERMHEKSMSALRGGKNAALGLAGSAVGGAVATGAGAKPSEYFKNSAAGLKDNVSRELKRKSGFAGNIARQADRVSSDNRRDLREASRKSATQSSNAADAAARADADATSAQSEVDATREGLQRDRVQLDDFNARAEVSHRVQHEVLGDMEKDNPTFAKAQGIANELQNLEMQHSQALAEGDTAKADQLAGRMEATRKDYAAANAEVTTFDRNRGERRYGTLTRKGMEAEGVKYDSEDRYAHMAAQERYTNEEAAIRPQEAAAESSKDAARQAQARAAALEAHSETVHKRSQDWRPGQKLTTAQKAKAEQNADIKAWESYRDAGGDLDEFEKSTGIKETPALTKHIEDTHKREDAEQKEADKLKSREEAAERRKAEKEKPRESLAEKKQREKENAAKQARASRDAHRKASDATGLDDSSPKPQREESRRESKPSQPKVTVTKSESDSSPTSIPQNLAEDDTTSSGRTEKPKPEPRKDDSMDTSKNTENDAKNASKAPKITIEAHDYSDGSSPTSIPASLFEDDDEDTKK